MNLYLVGSSSNGIGDTPNSADICIIVRRRENKAPVNGEVTANGEPTEEATKPAVAAAEESPADPAAAPADKDKEKEFVVVPEALSIDDPLVKYATSVKDSPRPDMFKETFAESMVNVLQTIEQGVPLLDGFGLSDIEAFLQGKGFAENVQLIPAKVPVIKFRDTITGLNITLNLNQEVSIRNSQLIRDYCKADWRFAPLAMVFKRWAQENRICNAVEQTISPYSWTLMTVHYLQTCEPPVLPCLQKLNPRRYEQHRGDIFKAIKAWRHQPARPWASRNNQTLRQLLKGLFRYYGYTFNYPQHIISVREGRVLDRSAFSRRTVVDGKAEFWLPNYWTSHLAIEEPFTKTNTACSVHDKLKFDRIIDLFRLSSGTLRGQRVSLYDIIVDDVFFPLYSQQK